MAFVVQDDTGTVADANAYIPVAFFNSYWTDRNPDALSDGSWDDPTVQTAIIISSGYVDMRWKFRGSQLAEDQTTEFPRKNLYDQSGTEVEGIPLKFKQSVAEYCLRYLQNGSLAPDPTTDETGAQVIEQTNVLGPITETIKYSEKISLSTFKSYPTADALVRGFIRTGQGRVIR